MFAKVLSFLRIVDEKSNLSITNLSFIAVLGKILASDVVSHADLIALVAVVANYAIKKAIVFFEERTPKPASIDVQELNATVTQLRTELEEAKSKISGLSIAASVSRGTIMPPRR